MPSDYDLLVRNALGVAVDYDSSGESITRSLSSGFPSGIGDRPTPDQSTPIGSSFDREHSSLPAAAVLSQTSPIRSRPEDVFPGSQRNSSLYSRYSGPSAVPSIQSWPESPAPGVSAIFSSCESPADDSSSSPSIPSVGSRPPSRLQSRSKSPLEGSELSSPGILSLESRPAEAGQPALIGLHSTVPSPFPSPVGFRPSTEHSAGPRVPSPANARASETSTNSLPSLPGYRPSPPADALSASSPIPAVQRPVGLPRVTFPDRENESSMSPMSVLPGRPALGARMPISIITDPALFPSSFACRRQMGAPLNGTAHPMLELNIAGIPHDNAKAAADVAKQGTTQAKSFIDFLEKVDAYESTFTTLVKDANRELDLLIETPDDEADMY